MYDADLAHVHHTGFSDFARLASPGLIRILRDAGARRGTVVDLGCGGGVWARRLVDEGYTVVGMDASRHLIGIARRVVPEAALSVGSIYRLDVPSCVAVTAIGEVLSYHPSGCAVVSRLSSLFRRVNAALSPGGVFVFDLFMETGAAAVESRSWRTGADWAVLVSATEDRRRRTLVREITTFRRMAGKAYRRSRERHVLSVAVRTQIEALLRAAGFSVRTTRRYGRFELPPRRLAFRARKPV